MKLKYKQFSNKLNLKQQQKQYYVEELENNQNNPRKTWEICFI